MANEGSTKPTELEFELRYIADSPTEGHGGFHPRVVKAAQDALAELLRVRGLLQRIEGEFREDSPTEVWRVVKEIFGAESADIGKLDTADDPTPYNCFDRNKMEKAMANPVCPKCYEGVTFKVIMHLGLTPPTKPLFVSCGACNHFIGEFDQMPMGKENRVEEKENNE